jgi:hypothetical protein
MEPGLTARIPLHVSNKTAYVWSLDGVEGQQSLETIIH